MKSDDSMVIKHRWMPIASETKLGLKTANNRAAATKQAQK
jgi:hypothetical protein